MTVKSVDLRERAAKESAIVSRSRLRRQRGAIERWTALVVLFVSFLGTIVTFAGGWPPFLAGLRTFQPAWGAIGGGLFVQGLLTYFQWHYFDRRYVSFPARIADAVLTALGYGPLVIDALTLYLTSRDAPQPLYLAWLVIGLVSYALAWYPESRLVD